MEAMHGHRFRFVIIAVTLVAPGWLGCAGSSRTLRLARLDNDLETLREKSWARFTGWGRSPMALAQASDLHPDETHSPFRSQVEKKEPFPTLTRCAQFCIDHDWFLEAGEELPMHKEAPAQGGGYGHLRYRALHWQPMPIDRGVRVDVAPAQG